MSRAPRSSEQLGTLQGFSAYAIWGLFPLYFASLEPAGAWEVLANRILWSLLLCMVVLGVTRDLRMLGRIARDWRTLLAVTIAALLICANWTIYVIAVMNNHVTEAALGYFLNPLVTVALGVIVLGERLRPLQWAAVGTGVIACAYLAVDYGKPPWISISLALSFASYGLMKKRIGVSMTAVQSLSAETAVLALPAAVILVLLGRQGSLTLTENGFWHAVLLIGSGLLTAIPLLLFAAAARRVPLVTIGLLQFITPILQLLCGVLLLGEHMPSSRWIGFGIVWLALILLSIDSLRSARARRAIAVDATAASAR